MGTLRLGNDVVVPSVVAKELVNKQKFGVSIDNFLGDVDSEGICSAPVKGFDFIADGVKDVGNDALYYAFVYKSINSVLFPVLTMISGSRACSYAFSNCSNLTSVSFPALTTISGSSACNGMFGYCYGLTSVSFPELTTISGSNACNSMFYVCSNLTSVSFPELTTISGSNACNSMFLVCSKLSSVSFPALATVERSDCMPANMFQGCSKLTEIHFRADAQTTIEGQSGYASKFGATNATIYFDL
mgnify:CR=1 FL=1